MSKTIYLIKRTKAYWTIGESIQDAVLEYEKPIVIKAFTDVNKANEYVDSLMRILNPYNVSNPKPYTVGMQVLAAVKEIDSSVPYFFGDCLYYSLESTILED